MDFIEFKNNLDRNKGPRSSMLFETFVIKLLEKYFNNKSKEFRSNITVRTLHGRTIELDAYAPDGIDELAGPTIIEIRYSASPSNMNKYLSKAFFKRYLDLNDKNELPFDSLFFIFGDKLDKDLKNKIYEIIESYKIKVKIWEPDDLSEIMNDDSLSSNSLELLSELTINNTIDNSLKRTPDERLSKRKGIIDRLANIYKSDGIVLFLGSGISNDVGIPLWDTLISDLLVEMIREKLVEKSIVIDDLDRDFIVKKLKNAKDTSPQLQARYIRTGLGRTFIKIISKVLYKDFRKPSNGWPELLDILSQLCLPRRSGRGGVQAIVTYNFDDVFEKVLDEKGLDYVSIYRESDIPSQDELGIYHVHGFLPNTIENDEKLSQSLLVFSEEGYHSLSLNPYSWQNITQLNFLRESTCIFVGLSLSDPNLRRLLAISASNSEYPRHFVILPKIIFEHDPKKEREDVIQSFSIVNEDLQEKSYQELGLNVIWAEDLEEIPGILAFLKKRR